MTFWKAVRRYWYIPLLFVGGIVAWVLIGWRKPGARPWASTERELNAIAAGAEADRVRVELGTEEALRHVNEKWAARRAQLKADQVARAEKLENDPEALARFIVRGTEP